jgi:type VI protein secretion system component Hcp
MQPLVFRAAAFVFGLLKQRAQTDKSAMALCSDPLPNAVYQNIFQKDDHFKSSALPSRDEVMSRIGEWKLSRRLTSKTSRPLIGGLTYMKLTLILLAFAFSAAIPAFADTDYLLVTPSTGVVSNTGGSSGCGSVQTTALPGPAANQTPEAITSFTFGGTDAASITTAGGRPALQNFVVSKTFDTCSGYWMTAFLTGAPLQTVTLYARKIGPTGQPTPFLIITLKDVSVRQYTVVGDSTFPAEQLSLTFTTIGITALKPNGGTMTLNYDSVSNTVQ